MKDALKTKWQKLSTREQVILAGGALFLCLLLSYTFFWQPLNSKIESMQTQIISQQQQLAWMKQVVPEIKRLQKQAEKIKKTSIAKNILTVIDETLHQDKLQTYSSQVNQVSATEVRVVFANVPFDPLVKWLTRLWQQNSISTYSISVLPQEIVGRVNVTVVLRRG